jgi:UDP-N-acetylmuramoyl-L-alanyl-D-glutamate--2,6-diaminopimelate ligase
MTILKDILYKVSLLSVSGSTEIAIENVCFDSRKARKGSLFVAVKGTVTDGHAFMDQVAEAGASAIVCEKLPEQLKGGVTYIAVKDSTEALGVIAANFYGNPSQKLQLIGVTGTNGKTTSVTLLHNLFVRLGYKTGLLSTVNNKINDKVIPSTHTTPDAVQLNELLFRMVNEGCTHCFMEVSSHAVVQHRIAGLTFAGGVFTNITHDHLDYHKTFDAYIEAKKLFFDGLPSSAFALSNIDDKRGMVMMQNTRASRNSFALKTEADFKGRLIANSLQGLQMEVDGREVWFKLIGEFNAYNLLAAYGVATLLGEDKEIVLQELSALSPAPGRFDRLTLEGGITAIVDYAHTPDALENVLTTIKDLSTGNEQVITVIGCGGNRDAAKRPVMADIACRYSTKVIFTSDNPRDEQPEQIIKEMQTGVKPLDYKKTLSITDRREAIKTACMLAGPGDIILVAGKGHEDYQEIKGVKHPFDDKQVLAEILKIIES